MRELLTADLRRQFEFGDKPRAVTGLALIARSLHPRFLPNILIRLSRYFWLLGIPLMSNLCTYINLIAFALEVSPKCDIGPGLFIPHPAGTVIGARKLGRNVTVFQNVSLAARYIDMRWNADLRPEVGDDVTLGAGCKVLGGIKIGDNVTIGANAVVLESVPANSVAVGIPARLVQRAMENG